MKKILEFIDLESGRLRKTHDNYPDEEKRALARMVKLSEEVGELADEVLSFNSMQRDEKQANHNSDSLSEEVADVLIVTLLLAKTLGVDVEKALEKKIEKINKRYEK
ncbi:MAG: hypothetical protein OEV93_05240 [Candidatus Moranbacteria bacterium]|nr:hypothetical protein [Candidatus Moranbacteria bacterium]